VTEQIFEEVDVSAPLRKEGILDRAARGAVRGQLARIGEGHLRVLEDRDVWSAGRAGSGPATTLRVGDPGMWRRVALGGPIGAAEAYMDGLWRADDLVALIRLLARNESAWGGMQTGLAKLTEPLRKLRHRLRRNTRSGSRRNIADHYDLGNDFFELFLYPTLTYSAAVFEHPEQDLESAQRAKYERICSKLDLGAADHVLEIGTGWGGFALHAASTRGCRVTTTTISREQHALATERVAEAGLADRVEILLEDYRDLTGRFDRLVSIEMVEAVGHEHLDGFFSVCSERLESHGAMALQAILHREQDWESSKRSVDFIKRYIFPGGQLISMQGIASALAAGTDLRMTHYEDITAHYAETLSRWREVFLKRSDAVAALGLDERFRAMWEYYLAYCEGGFRERVIGTAQLVFEKPRSRCGRALGSLTPLVEPSC
jgi:cyclopropane-fatty-acyl-phospholipid synthase